MCESSITDEMNQPLLNVLIATNVKSLLKPKHLEFAEKTSFFSILVGFILIHQRITEIKKYKLVDILFFSQNYNPVDSKKIKTLIEELKNTIEHKIRK